MKKALLFLLPSALVLIAASPGIRPRADANSYPVHQEQTDFSIGAVVIPPQQVKKMFKPDLNHAGYVVIEVGVFPAAGKDIDLYPSDFTLSVGEKSAALRPVSADTIADILAGNREPPRPAGPLGPINTSAGISVGHGTYPDPVTGRRTSGTITDTEAGVGIGGPAPRPCRGYDCDSTVPVPTSQPSPVQTANTVAQDLWEKSLPDGKTVHPVAGYLYFPKPPKAAKDADWELRYENANVKTRLLLPK